MNTTHAILSALLKNQKKDRAVEGTALPGQDLVDAGWVVQEAAGLAGRIFMERCGRPELGAWLLGLPLESCQPGLKQAIEGLPGQADEGEGRLEAALREQIEQAWLDLAPEQVDQAVKDYRESLSQALLEIRGSGGRPASRTVIRIEQDIQRVEDSAGVTGLEVNQMSGPVTVITPSFRAREDDWQPLDWDSPAEIPEPGQLPPGYTIAFTRNGAFVGRQADLLALAEALYFTPRRSSKPPRHLIVMGMGGAGKTQLAVEFCFRYGRFFKGVHWVQADRDISQEIVDCGAAMRLADWPDSASERVDATLLSWSRGGHLVVFDNLEDAQTLDHWRKRLVNTSLLVTTRLADWPEDLAVQIHPLGRLSQSESVALLCGEATRLVSEPRPEVEYIARQLGELPLALALAGTFLRENPKTALSAYLDELGRVGGLAILEETEIDPASLPTRHRDTITATLRVQWQGLNSRPAQLALKAAALLGEKASVERSRLSRFSGLPDQAPGLRKAPLDGALRRLKALSLLESLDDYEIRLHPLVREFAAHPAVGEEILPDFKRSLRMLMADRQAAEAERRLAAFLLTHLDWLNLPPAPSTEELLTYLELLGAYASLPEEQQYLLDRAILPCLALESGALTARQEAHLWKYAGAMHALLKDYEAAEEDYQKARRLLARLLETEPVQPEDQNLAALVYLGSANVLRFQAEKGELPGSERHRKLNRALSHYREAISHARAAPGGAALEAKILNEESYAFTLLPDWKGAEGSYRSALEALQDEVRLFAQILGTASELYWKKAESLQSAPEKLCELETAYRLTEDSIVFLRRSTGDSDDLVMAYLNAGLCLKEIAEHDRGRKNALMEAAREYWTKAENMAGSLGLADLEKDAHGLLEE